MNHNNFEKLQAVIARLAFTDHIDMQAWIKPSYGSLDSECALTLAGLGAAIHFRTNPFPEENPSSLFDKDFLVWMSKFAWDSSHMIKGCSKYLDISVDRRSPLWHHLLWPKAFQQLYSIPERYSNFIIPFDFHPGYFRALSCFLLLEEFKTNPSDWFQRSSMFSLSELPLHYAEHIEAFNKIALATKSSNDYQHYDFTIPTLDLMTDWLKNNESRHLVMSAAIYSDLMKTYPLGWILLDLVLDTHPYSVISTDLTLSL